jgi:hypothetical protein
MSRFRFDLKLVFLIVTNVCVVAWGGAALAHQSLWFLIVPVVTAMSGALCSRWSAGRAILLGAIGGAVGAASLPLVMCALNDVGYFFHDGPGEYFEDGALVEVVLYPIGYILSWGPAGALVGAIVGSVVGGFIALENRVRFTR